MWVNFMYPVFPRPHEDEDLSPKEVDKICYECKGDGKYLLFNFWHTCKMCKGKKKIKVKQ